MAAARKKRALARKRSTAKKAPLTKKRASAAKRPSGNKRAKRPASATGGKVRGLPNDNAWRELIETAIERKGRSGR